MVSCQTEMPVMTHRRIVAPVFFALFFCILGPLKTEAQSVWASGSSGNWNTASAWNPAAVPGLGANTYITNAATFTVTYDSPMSAASIAFLASRIVGARGIVIIES